MTFIETMQERGFVKDTSFDPSAAPDKIIAYIGFDLTAPSLHVGSLIQLMVLRHLRKHGHTPIVVLGEATTRIGDPSGKNSARKMLTSEEIETNRIGIQCVIDRVVGDIKVVSNADWLNDWGPSFMSFLTDFGPHFTINRMLTFDSVKRRLDAGDPLTFLEFSYMLLQATDFFELNKRFGVNMQIGGSDQWGNMVNGLELIRRMRGTDACVMTTPLLLDSKGEKMGKSQGKPVWLDPAMTTPFDFFQFWRNVADEDVRRFFLLFTELSIGEVDLHMAKDINEAKKTLAFFITKIVHGVDVANRVWDEVTAIFENKEIVASREVTVTSADIISVMVEADLAPSKSQAKRLIAQNAVNINERKVTSIDEIISDGEILKVGKQAPVKVKL